MFRVCLRTCVGDDFVFLSPVSQQERATPIDWLNKYQAKNEV